MFPIVVTQLELCTVCLSVQFSFILENVLYIWSSLVRAKYADVSISRVTQASVCCDSIPASLLQALIIIRLRT